jgi:hypothetical protein
MRRVGEAAVGLKALPLAIPGKIPFVWIADRG